MKEDRTIFDIDDEEYINMSDEERHIITQNTNDLMNEIMFPDGQDEE